MHIFLNFQIVLQLSHRHSVDIAKAVWLVLISQRFRDGLGPSFVKTKFGGDGNGLDRPYILCAVPLRSQNRKCFCRLWQFENILNVFSMDKVQELIWCLGRQSIKALIAPSGHRPPTWLRQALVPRANLSNCLQVKRVSLTAASRSRRKLFMGRPLSAFSLLIPGWSLPCDAVDCFDVRVWPIHLQRLCRIFCSTGIWHMRCHNRSLHY